MREYTNRLLEMIEEDLVDPIKVVEMCLNYMSEDEVKAMGDEDVRVLVQRPAVVKKLVAKKAK
jgi:hypothetical protein